MQHSRGVLTGAKWKGKITSLDLVVTLVLMQPRDMVELSGQTVLAHFKLLIYQHPQVRSALNPIFYPACICTWNLYQTHVQDLTL